MQNGTISMNEWGEMDQQHHIALHERHDEKLDALLEYVRDIPVILHRVSSLETRTERVENKLDVVSEIVKEHSQDIREIKTDVATLKSDVAVLKSR